MLQIPSSNNELFSVVLRRCGRAPSNRREFENRKVKRVVIENFVLHGRTQEHRRKKVTAFKNGQALRVCRFRTLPSSRMFFVV